MIKVYKDEENKEVILKCDCGNDNPEKFSRYVKAGDKKNGLSYMCKVCIETISALEVEIELDKLKEKYKGNIFFRFLMFFIRPIGRLTLRLKLFILKAVDKL